MEETETSVVLVVAVDATGVDVLDEHGSVVLFCRVLDPIAVFFGMEL